MGHASRKGRKDVSFEALIRKVSKVGALLGGSKNPKSEEFIINLDNTGSDTFIKTGS